MKKFFVSLIIILVLAMAACQGDGGQTVEATPQPMVCVDGQPIENAQSGFTTFLWEGQETVFYTKVDSDPQMFILTGDYYFENGERVYSPQGNIWTISVIEVGENSSGAELWDICLQQVVNQPTPEFFPSNTPYPTATIEPTSTPKLTGDLDEVAKGCYQPKAWTVLNSGDFIIFSQGEISVEVSWDGYYIRQGESYMWFEHNDGSLHFSVGYVMEDWRQINIENIQREIHISTMFHPEIEGQHEEFYVTIDDPTCPVEVPLG